MLAFAAVSDIRYYLNGVHVVPGGKTAAVRMEGTDGHMLYAEEDKSATVQKDLIVAIGKRGRSLLRGANRVKVFDNKAVQITDEMGAVLYIEPGQGVVDGTFPNIAGVMAKPDQWHEGLGGTVNTKYLLKALSVPGYVRFFSQKDAQGRFEPKASVMFVMDGGTVNGGKAFGLIMPMRGAFDPHSMVADMLPDTLRPMLDAAKAVA